MHQTQYEYLFKILLIGDDSVGKSSLLTKLADDIFTESSLPTIGIDFKLRKFDLDGNKINLSFWDTAGQSKYLNLTNLSYKNAFGILLIFDLTNQLSFLNLKNWVK
jgi:Ras-related protein Rab-1A